MTTTRPSGRRRRVRTSTTTVPASVPTTTNVPMPGTIGAQLLYDRGQTGHLLNRSKSTLVRMEKRGLLRPLRPSGSPNGEVHYTGQNLLEIAGGDNG